MSSKQVPASQTKCLNCHAELSEAARYCHQCGQKNFDGRISLKEFINHFFENVFNLDSRIFQTITKLCIPGKLTIEYFKGKHRTYYHPIRLYLVMSLIFFAILSLKKDSIVIGFNVNTTTKSALKKAEKEKHFLEFSAILDTTKQLILKDNEHPEVKAAMDSLFQQLPQVPLRDSINITLITREKEYKFDQRDVMTLEADELIEKYKVEGLFNKISVRQGVRFARDQALFFRQIVSNLPWMLLVMMPALALFFKILYIRHKRFFVEHLVFNFHHHAFAFFLFSIIFLLPHKYTLLIAPFGAGVVLIFLFLAMIKVYQQGFGKTFIKFSIFNVLYLLSFLLALSITFILSFFLF